MPNESEIDLIDLLWALWLKREIVVLSCLLSLGFAAIYAFIIARPVYESSALLLPTQTTSNSDLGAAAALLGGKKSISADVDLYQSLLRSRTVISKLLKDSIRNGSDTSRGQIEPLYQILKIDTSKAGALDGAAQLIEKSVIVGSKESGAGGILEVKFLASEPWLAQQIGNRLLEIGQEELRLVRLERSNVIMSRLSVAVTQAHSEWDTATKNLTAYKDYNRSILLPQQMLELARLEMEKSAKEQKYLLARKEYEIQMLEREKAAPPMMVLDPANLPTYKTKPRRTIILAVGLAFGCLIGCAGILTWNALSVILVRRRRESGSSRTLG